MLVAAIGWLVMVYPEERGSGSGKVVSVRIAPGMRLHELAVLLEQRRLVRRGWLWGTYARFLGASSRLRHGQQVLLRDNMQARAVLQRLARGYGDAPVRVTIPEGQNRFEIASLLQRWGICTREAFVAASADPQLLAALEIPGDSAEGYLFPDTYELQARLGAERIVRRLVRNASRRRAPLLHRHGARLAQLKAEFGWGLHQAVTLASIVEKEARVRPELGVIAGVFLNRLREPSFRPRRLQADPTVAYGCLGEAAAAPSCGSFDGRRITKAMLLDAANPYNTYRAEGLPPGPIANPGLAALEAVLSPTRHGFFYFVARGDGRHHFSTTLEEHLRFVENYRTRSTSPQ